VKTATGTLRYGVVGVGRMGRHHVRLGTQLEGLELVGVVDRDADRRAEMLEKYGGKGYSEVDALIEAGVDVVVIATPTIHHRAAAEKLLAEDKAYRCYATAEELTTMREEQKARGLTLRSRRGLFWNGLRRCHCVSFFFSLVNCFFFPLFLFT
jgi:predicted dehydrogenase